EQGRPEPEVRHRVERYIDEIVPYFNVLSYYRLGYNLARVLLHLLYRPTVAAQDADGLTRIPRRDVVVYLMNHRSNADYVVVAFVLAQRVSISYAVGEWARTWPLEIVFKSFGSYFIRRRYREPLYHTVLERYIQLITRNGVTQGIFPEGGLSPDGALRPAKIGLLDYILRTLDDPAFDRDIWFVPVGLNYDRVLEDRTLIRERILNASRPSRLAQAGTVAGYLLGNAVRLVTGRLRRYGRVAVTFGAPVSARAWLATEAPGLLARPKEERLPRVQRFADQLMTRIGALVPVTPVPLGAAALLSFGTSVVRQGDLLDRMDALRDRLAGSDATLVRGELGIAEVWARAERMFVLRRCLARQGDAWVILPRQRPLLEYYANSIAHLLPADQAAHFSPAREPDTTLPRLATRAEVEGTRPTAPGSGGAAPP
ncbi:MAG TPA: 1-acyl-sn-glycerol-3-phosphate acyltransferase, partial [Gemmatimonadales bacterium]|nr:1-acyl-sn-glycerol-3-phosphate acyltransferase [Gemmatimonadales bacterium]